MKRILLSYSAVTLILLSSTALAESTATAKNASPAKDVIAISGVDVGSLLQQLAEQEKRLQEQEKQLAAQRERVQFLSSQVNKLITANNLSTLAPAAGASAAAAKTNIDPASSSTPEEVGVARRPREKDRPPKIEAVENSGGVLLRPGQMVLEPAIEYSRSSATRVAVEGFTIIPALNIGSFEISQVDRDTMIGSATARLGLTNRIEAEVRVPYVYRDDTTTGRPIGTGSSTDTLSNINGDDIGDIEVAGRYQINNGEMAGPS